MFLAGNRALFLSFVFGFVVRLVPEVLLSPYPMGFDPIYYAWRIKSGVVWSHWSHVFSAWLLHGILVPLYNATQVNLFGLLKVTAALLFGFVACGMCYFATRGLGWTSRRGLFAGVFFSLQAAALFISANFYRNMLGLGILLFTLPFLKDDLRSTKRFAVFAVLSVLVVLGHEVASIIFFVAVLGFLVTRFLRGNGLSVKRHLIAVIPALVLSLISFYFLASPAYPVEINSITLDETGNYERVLPYFTNYLVDHPPNQSAVYWSLTSQIFSFFGVLYILVLPFVLVGFFRDAILSSWTAVVLTGSFGAVLMPVFALSAWSRWMLMLVFPLTFYAVNGIERFMRSGNESFEVAVKRPNWMKLSKKAVKLIIIILPIVSGLILAAIALPAQVSVVPPSDLADTERVMLWVDSQVGNGSVLLVNFAFYWWARFSLSETCARIYFKYDVEGALSLALERGYSDVYFVWWNEKIDWFSLSVPEGFSSVFSSGRVCVLEYSG